jgi:hypothetical protein
MVLPWFLQASAKVQYLIGRTHMLANLLGFQTNATDTPQRRELQRELHGTVDELKETYFTLLYGGLLKSQVNVGRQHCKDKYQRFDGCSYAPASSVSGWLSPSSSRRNVSSAPTTLTSNHQTADDLQFAATAATGSNLAGLVGWAQKKHVHHYELGSIGPTLAVSSFPLLPLTAMRAVMVFPSLLQFMHKENIV